MPKNRKQLLAVFEAQPERVKKHFKHLPKLIEYFPLHMAICYIFPRVEYAHRITIYGGLRKKLKCDTSLADEKVLSAHLGRAEVDKLLNDIFGASVPGITQERLKNAANIRNEYLHGKWGNKEAEFRSATKEILEYAREFNAYVLQHGQFEPFGPLQGFAGGRTTLLDEENSRLLLKSIGLSAGRGRATNFR